MTKPFAGACVALLLSVGAALPAYGQDPPPPDSLEVLPDSVREVFADTTPPRAQEFPGRLTALRGPGHEIFDCDRECIHAAAAFSLIELLLEHVPGMTGIRGGYYAGPHHAFDGVLGPGFVTLYVDGREVPSLERAQADLRRVSLNYVDRVRVYRGADGLVIDVDFIRHDGVQAYSRIGGGTGDPRTDILDAVFANRLGGAFNVEASFERHDINERRDGEQIDNDRFGAQARLSWMPRSNDFGVQFEYRTESIDRSAIDTMEVGRREFIMRTRANLGERAQLEAYGHTSSFKEVVEGLPDSIPAPQRGADGVGLRFSARPGAGAVSLGLRFAGRDAYASRVADLAAWQPIGPFAIEAGAELASWNEFPTKSWRGGLAFQDTLLFPIALRAFAAGGTRGVGFPEHPMADSLETLELVAADSVGFSARGASAAFTIGPFDVSGRYSRQQLDRQLGFGAPFDRMVVPDSGEVDVTSLEVRFDGPVVPVGLLIGGMEPIRLRASWRKFTSNGAASLFLPDRLFRTELYLYQTAFSENLRVWVSVFVDRRGARLVPAPGSAEPVMLEADSWMGGRLMFKIGDFRFFWRFGNLGAADVSDFQGALFPNQVNMFGLRWEFLN
ncbi:TonB-dependent receptor plug domain-containing protein [Candidatus Palauibacter sp.]|uniref:TonB-dependent receptor plug domain-containing protein n=1 Tax=Candidatus Palauibacter sp. TaxID=3101350 RepID=UPI003AF2CB11